MAERQQETVTAFPFQIFRTIVKRMKIKSGKHIGNPEGLTDISLSLSIRDSVRHMDVPLKFMT